MLPDTRPTGHSNNPILPLYGIGSELRLEAIEGALRSLSVPGIEGVRQGKVFDIEIAAGTDAARGLEDAREKLLANKIMQNYRVGLT